MQQSQKTSEPSMEEILASIRKIIAEDPSGVPAPAQTSQSSAPQAAAPQASKLPEPPRAEAPIARRLPEGGAMPQLNVAPLQAAPKERQDPALPFAGLTASAPANAHSPASGSASGQKAPARNTSALERDLADLLGDAGNSGESPSANGHQTAANQDSAASTIKSQTAPAPRASSRASWLRRGGGAAEVAPAEPAVSEAPALAKSKPGIDEPAPLRPRPESASAYTASAMVSETASKAAPQAAAPDASPVPTGQKTDPAVVASGLGVMPSGSKAPQGQSITAGPNATEHQANVQGRAALPAKALDAGGESGRLSALPDQAKATASAPDVAPTSPSQIVAALARQPATTVEVEQAGDRPQDGTSVEPSASSVAKAAAPVSEAAAPAHVEFPADAAPAPARMIGPSSIPAQQRHQPAPAPTREAPAATPSEPVRSLDDALAELLRPMVRQWLDENMTRALTRAVEVELAERARLELSKRKTS